MKEFLLSLGSDITYGARPLKRTIQRHLINPLSAELLVNYFLTGDKTKTCSLGGGIVKFENGSNILIEMQSNKNLNINIK